MTVNYYKGDKEKFALNGVNCGIFSSTYAGEITYTGVTLAASKTFKTLKSAERWMNKQGYKRLES